MSSLLLEAAAVRAAWTACTHWSEFMHATRVTLHGSKLLANYTKRNGKVPLWAVHRGVLAKRLQKDVHGCSVCSTEGTCGLLRAHITPTSVPCIILANYPAALTEFGFPPHRSSVASSVRKRENTMQERGEAHLGFKYLLSANTHPPSSFCTLSVPPSPPPFLPSSSSSNFHSVGLGRTHLVTQTLLMDQLSPIPSTESETGQKVSKGWIQPPCTPSFRQWYFTLKARIKHEPENGN